jgi:hypothetical protein
MRNSFPNLTCCTNGWALAEEFQKSADSPGKHHCPRSCENLWDFAFINLLKDAASEVLKMYKMAQAFPTETELEAELGVEEGQEEDEEEVTKPTIPQHAC